MSAPRLTFPGTASGGIPVGGVGTVDQMTKWLGTTTIGDSATSQVTGAVNGYSITNPGAGYTPGTYTAVPMVGGTGTGAVANIVVSGAGVVTSCTVIPGNGGKNYTVGDALTAPTLPGGAGFAASVSETALETVTDAGAFVNRFRLSATAGHNRILSWSTGKSPRWAMRVDAVAESGSNAGSNWQLRRYTDAGVVVDAVLQANRAGGQVWAGNNFGVAGDPGAGLAIASLTNLGAAATTGTYKGVALTGGSGTGATADIAVVSSVVQHISLDSPGQGYVAGDALSCPAIGAVGAVATVASVVNYAGVTGDLYATQRIGAGTSRPEAGLDSRSGALVAGWQRKYTLLGGSGYNISTMALVSGTEDPSAGGLNALVGVGSLPILSSLNPALAVGVYSWPGASNTSGAGSIALYSHFARVLRSFSGDANTNTTMFGTFYSLGHASGGAASYASTALTAVRINAFFQVPGSVVDVHGVRSTPSNITNATAITTWTAFTEEAFTLSGGATIGTYYGLRLAAITGAVTTRWGISQEDPLGKSRFYGNLGVGNALDVGAGKIIASFTLTNAGAGYTAGTYSQVALTTVTGSGSGATADIVVAGGIVTTVVLRSPGQGYAVGDTLSCASIGAGAGFLVTVSTTASIVRSDGTVVAPRIGAGTTTPVSTLDALGVASIRKAGFYNALTPSTLTYARSTSFLNVDTTAESGSVLTIDAAESTVFGLRVAVPVDASLSTVGVSFTGASVLAAFRDVNAAGSKSVRGGQFAAQVTGVTTGKTIAAVYGIDAQAVVSSNGGNTITLMAGGFFTANVLGGVAETITERAGIYVSGSSFLNAAHVITNYYAARFLAPTLGGGATITNRWGIAQEDASGFNVFAGLSAFGLAAGTKAGAVVDVAGSSTARSALRLRSGTAPTAPNDGDIWFDGTNVKIQVAGVTKTFTII